MSNYPRVAILLATYNGALYLREQLESILNQTYPEFVIVVRDDNSSDDSLALVQSHQAQYPDKFHLLESDACKRGASGSFSCLLEYALENKQALGLDRAYLMFCDQDDVWFPDKIALQMKAMLEAEAGHSSMPVLVHSDLEVVAENRAVIAPSFVRFQGLDISRNNFPGLVISNLVTGCTALINEALAEKACPVSKQAIMHDWWLALVATAFGKLVFIDRPLVHYRQHGNNTIGAREFTKSAPTSLSLWRHLLVRKPNVHLYEVARQAKDFRLRFGSQLSARQRIGLRVAALMRVRVGLLQHFCYRLARRF